MRIFKGLQRDQTGEVCQCCERRVGIESQTTMFCYDNMKLAGLGPGVPLLFAFIKYSIIFLALLGITFVGFALYSNIASGYCSTLNHCSNNFLDSFSIFNKAQNESFLAIQNYTVLAFCILSVFILQYFRYNFRKIEDQCDGMINTPSDYAIILRRLPDGTTKRDIQFMIQNRRITLTEQEIEKTENLKVDHIVMSFSMTEYNKIKAQNCQQFHKLLSEEKHQEFKPKPLPKLSQPASLAIVIFSKQESKKFFRYKSNILQNILQCFVSVCVPLSNFQVKGQRIAVERAPEPDDIIWENSKISMGGALFRKLIYNFLAILLLAFGYAAQYGLAVAKNKISQDSTTQLIMSSAFSITVSILNAVIQIFLGFTSKRQRTQTLTQFNSILMAKLSVFQFLNTGVFVILAQFMANMDNFSLNGGIVFEITQVMLLNAILPNITLFLLSYFQILKKVQRYFIKSQFIKSSQLESNIAFEGPEAQFPFKYAYIFKTLWLSAFYAPLSPVIVPISILGLLINYFLEKCLFGHSYATPNIMSAIVNDSAVEMMQYAVLALPVGSYIIYLYFYSFSPDKLPSYWSIPIYVTMGVAVLNLMLPMDVLNKKLFKIVNDSQMFPTYDKIEKKFEVTYQMTNPGYICKKKRKRDLFAVSQITQEKGIPLVDITGVRLLANNNLQSSLVSQQDTIYENDENCESGERSATNRIKQNISNSFHKPQNNTTRNTEDISSHQSFPNETNKTNECQTLQGVPPQFLQKVSQNNECNISIIVEDQNNQIIMEASFHDQYGNRDYSNTIWYNVPRIQKSQNLSTKLSSSNPIPYEQNKFEQSQKENKENIPIQTIIEEEEIKIQLQNEIAPIINNITQVFEEKENEQIKSQQTYQKSLKYENQQTKQKPMQIKPSKQSQQHTIQQQIIQNTQSFIISSIQSNKSMTKSIDNHSKSQFEHSNHNCNLIGKQNVPISLLNYELVGELLQQEYISQRSESVQQTEEKFPPQKPFFLLDETDFIYPNQVMPKPIGRLISQQAFELIYKNKDKVTENNKEQQNVKLSSQTEIESPNKSMKSSKKKPPFFPSKFKQFIWKPPSENVDFNFNEWVSQKSHFESNINTVQPPPMSIVQQSQNYSNSRERRQALRLQNIHKLPFTKIIFKEY